MDRDLCDFGFQADLDSASKVRSVSCMLCIMSRAVIRGVLSLSPGQAVP